MAKIPILTFRFDGREEQFGFLGEMFNFHFVPIITDLEKKIIQNALVAHLGKTEKYVSLFLSVGRLCLTMSKHTMFSVYFHPKLTN